MPTHTSFKNVSEYGRPLLSDTLEANFFMFLNWAFLEAGAFSNVSIPASGAYGGQKHRLRLCDDRNYPITSGSGQVWEGFRKDWVWETGLQRSSEQQPIRVSGVFVGGVFRPATGVGPHAHRVDYTLGRILFDSPIPTGSIVTCEYSYRNVQVSTADTPWWREVQQNSLRVDDNHFLQYGSGAWHLQGGSRIQLPAIIVEAAPSTRRTGKELGGGEIVRQDVYLHVLTETPWDRKQLHDILTYQWGKRLLGFDKDRLYRAGAYPLDEYHSPVSSGKMYPDLVKPSSEGGFGWEQLRIMDAESLPLSRQLTGPLYGCSVRWEVEVDLP